jgi:hypothetical protein
MLKKNLEQTRETRTYRHHSTHAAPGVRIAMASHDTTANRLINDGLLQVGYEMRSLTKQYGAAANDIKKRSGSWRLPKISLRW